jgi:hypothetical protein
MKRAGRAADARNCWAKVVHVPAGRWPHRRLDGPGPGPVDGDDLKGLPYGERRQILEELRLDGSQWKVPEAFEDGEALRAAVCEHELEGVVAKRVNEPSPVRRAVMGEGKEPLLLAIRARTRERRQEARRLARLAQLSARPRGVPTISGRPSESLSVPCR